MEFHQLVTIFFWGNFQKSFIEEADSYMTVAQRVTTSDFNTIKAKNNSKFTECNRFFDHEHEYEREISHHQQKLVDGYFQMQQAHQIQQNSHTPNGMNHFNEKIVFSEIDSGYKKSKEKVFYTYLFGMYVIYNIFNQLCFFFKDLYYGYIPNSKISH